jgi:two-component system, chemotaxis family, sensor kinase CheA
MTSIPMEVNRELLLSFIDESIDGLAAVDDLLIKLEASPTDKELVNAVFRPIHSLKGNAAYFGLMKIKKLAHTMENLLDLVRKGQRSIDRTIIDVVLPGADCLKKMLLKVHDGGSDLDDEVSCNAVIAKIDEILGSPTTASGADKVSVIRDLLDILYMQTTKDGAETVDKLVSLLATIPSLSNIRIIASAQAKTDDCSSALPGPAGDLLTMLSGGGPFPKDSEKTKQLAELMNRFHNENSNEPLRTQVQEIFDIFNVFMRADTGIDELAISMLREKLSGLRSFITVNPSAPIDATGPKPAEDSKQKADAPAKHEKTMRIPEQSLDDFLRCVGELLSIEEGLRHVTLQIKINSNTLSITDGLRDVLRQFEAISKELRSKIMEVRKVEARALLQKTSRIARDICVQSGKKITIECVGENLLIDKSYIDLLDAPLTHMVRNAADHGIELPAVRMKAGKPETGKISIILRETENDLLLIISDDGAGLNYEGLRKKAVELGMISAAAQLSTNDTIELLFQSGVSTASLVTEISGRGVGMDVVKRAITETGGKIDVKSKAGAGTTFTVMLPRNASTQIIDGYIVQGYSMEMYVLPLGFVIEAFNILPRDISSIAGKTKMISRHGATFPMHMLDNLLGSSFVETDDARMGVLVQIKGKKKVLIVKDIIGIQKVVCKQVEGALFDGGLFQGASVNGAGRVLMIVNMEKLLTIC